MVRVRLKAKYVRTVVTILLVDSTHSRVEFQAPHWTRVCVHSVLIVGIFAMHNLLAGDGDQLTPHHATPMSATQSDAAMGPAAVDADHDQLQLAEHGDGHGPLGPLSDCCGLLVLCLSMIVGAGALLFIRSKSVERVLWQLPPPSHLREVLRASPFQRLTPLQRSSILRC